MVMDGKDQVQIDSAGPGMVVAVAKLKDTVTGDTLCAQDAPIIYDELEPMDPCITYAVAADDKKNEEKLRR